MEGGGVNYNLWYYFCILLGMEWTVCVDADDPWYPRDPYEPFNP